MTLSKKKILIFSLVYYPDFVGGAEVAIKEITDRLGDEIEFYMVTLCAPKNLPKQERVGHVTLHRVSGWMPFPLGKLFFPFTAFFAACRIHKANRFDCVWAVMANYGGFAALFFKYFYPRVPYILTLQEGDPISYIKRRVRFVYPLFKRIFTKADSITAISNYLALWAKSMGAKSSISIVPNGVDMRVFGSWQDLAEQAKLRQELGIKSSEKVVITTSRLVEKNAVGDIIDAFTFLPAEIKFLVVGNGPLEAALKEHSAKLGLDQRVIFIGYVSHDQLPNYLRISDIFIRPSLSEGMGNSFIEAMAAGIPVIATNVGGIPDFLKDKETGLFCAVKDPADIARKVTIILRDQEIRSYIIGNAQRLVYEKYGWPLIAQKMKDVLLLGSPTSQ